MASMNQMMKSAQSVLLKSVLLAAVAVAVHAVEPEAPPAGRDGLHDRHGAMCKDEERCPMQDEMGKHHERMAEELKLDDKQRQLFDAAMKSMRETMDGKMAMHKDLMELVDSDQYTEQKARELVHQALAGMEDKTVASATAMHAFKASLTPEQRDKMKKMREDRHDKMKDRRKDRMKDRRDEQTSKSEPGSAEHTDGHEHNH